MAFENLRKYLMEDDEDKIKEIEQKISNKDGLYTFLCAFYTECEVKGVDLHYKSRKYIIDYVVKYRMNYAAKGTSSNDSDKPGNIANRIQCLKEIINENEEIHHLNPIELITFLKTVVRIIRPLIFDKNAPRLPWAKIQFVICIFIAIKSDKNRLPDWLGDNYYQLMVTEEFIKKLLRLLLSKLKDKGKKVVDWSELDDVFNISKMYYLVMKMNWRYQHFDYNSEETIKADYLQTMGEWLFQLQKLNYSDFEDSGYMTQQINMFSTIFVDLRHKLVHSHKVSFFNVKIDNLGLFIIELVQIVRSKIEERILKEFKTILAQSVDKLLERVNEISFTTFSYENVRKFKPFEIIQQILNDMRNQNNSLVICDIGSKLMNLLSPQRYSNETLLHFINNLKRNSKIDKDVSENPNLSVEVITAQLNQISPQPFVNLKILLRLFLSLIPNSEPKQELENLLNNLNKDYVTEEPRNADDETFIQYIFLKIEKGIEENNDKNEFSRIVSKLMKERCDFYESKIFKNSKSSQLRNNPVQSIINNKNKNWSEPEIVEKFLKDINWKNFKSVVDKIPKEKSNIIRLDNTLFRSSKPDLKETDIQFILESCGLVKKIGAELSYDFNFLDFDCPIPIGRNLRNYLAHGDVCVDVLCPDIRFVIDKHKIFFEDDTISNQYLGFSRPDDFDLVMTNFRKNMKWAREAWELLNWNNDIEVLEKYESDPMAFRVRDPAGLTIVHYSLKEINDKNEFLNFLIRKLEKKYSTQDEFLEKLLTKFITPTYLSTKTMEYFNIHEDPLNYNSISFHIKKLSDKELVVTLAQVLCFNCPSLEIFIRIFSQIVPNYPWVYRGLLQIAVAQNQMTIVKYLLKQDFIKNEIKSDIEKYLLKQDLITTKINSEYNGFSALKYAIMNGNAEMARILIDNGADVNYNSNREYLKRTHKSYAFKGDEYPFSVALAYGDYEMLSLLKSRGMRFNNKFNYDFQQKIKININSDAWNCILNSFCETKEDFETFLYIACINEKFDIVKTIIETKPLDWSSIRETILMSCCSLKSPEILKYLLERNAVLKLEHLKMVCMFGTIQVVEYLIGNDYFKKFSLFDLIGRNKEIVGALLDENCKIDWKAIDFLPLEFILEQNPQKNILSEKIINFLMLSSFKQKSELIKYLNERGIRIPLSVLEYAATELGLENCKWLRECEFEETTEGWNERLKTAVKCDHYVLARIALTRGADINISLDGRTLLDFYIEKNVGKVTEIMKMLFEFKCPSRFGIVFSNFAVQDQLLFGHLTKNEDMIEKAKKKADLNFKYSNFRDGTILHILYHYGIEFGKKEEVSSIKNLDNCTPFDLFVLNNSLRPLPSHFFRIAPFQRLIAGVLRSDFEIIEDALESGADINSVVEHFNYYTPLHVAVRENLIKVVEYLLQRGSNTHRIYRYQQLPIETSILCSDNDSMVDLLLRNMTFLPNDDLDYLLKLTKKEGRKKVLKVLIQSKQHNLKTRLDFESALDRGLYINSVPNEYQETYLHIACYNSDLELVKFLLENGADPLVRNCFNEFPIEITVVKDDSFIVELFLKNYLSYDLEKLLELAFENNSLKSAKMLLENGATINDDLLQYPCRMKNNSGLELAKLLFKFDKKCFKFCKYFNKAVDNNNYILAKLMLKEAYRISNINLFVYEDWEMALEKGINFNRGWYFLLFNRIPYLRYATFCCDSNVFQLLLKTGTNPFITNCFDKLPIEYAIRLDDVEKVKLLFEGQPFELKSESYDIYNKNLKSYNLSKLLVLATKCKSLKSFKYLILKSFNEINKDGNVIYEILEIACALELNKGLEILTYFLEMNLKPLELRELLNISKENNNFEVATLLISTMNKDICKEEPLSLSMPCRFFRSSFPFSIFYSFPSPFSSTFPSSFNFSFLSSAFKEPTTSKKSPIQ